MIINVTKYYLEKNVDTLKILIGEEATELYRDDSFQFIFTDSQPQLKFYADFSVQQVGFEIALIPISKS